MLPEIAQLLVLQDRDRKIRSLAAELKLAPVERKDRESQRASAAAALEQAKHAGKELEVERKKLEVEAQAKRDSIGKFKGQQFQTRKNEEFQALSNEIKRFGDDISKLEDRELDLMESAEQMRAKVAAAEQEDTRMKAQVAERLADLDKKVAAIEVQLQEITADRARLAEAVEEDLLTRYDRLFASKGDAAVVPLAHEVCTGCHMKITPQTAVRVKGGRDVMSCEQCGRILYSDD